MYKRIVCHIIIIAGTVYPVLELTRLVLGSIALDFGWDLVCELAFIQFGWWLSMLMAGLWILGGKTR